MKSAIYFYIAVAIFSVAISATPAFAGQAGYSTCMVQNEKTKKIFHTPVFARESGNAAADASAFIKDKGLDQKGTYDKEPPSLIANCEWMSSKAKVEEKLKAILAGAKAQNMNMLGLNWEPAIAKSEPAATEDESSKTKTAESPAKVLGYTICGAFSINEQTLYLNERFKRERGFEKSDAIEFDKHMDTKELKFYKKAAKSKCTWVATSEEKEAQLEKWVQDAHNKSLLKKSVIEFTSWMPANAEEDD